MGYTSFRISLSILKLWHVMASLRQDWNILAYVYSLSSDFYDWECFITFDTQLFWPEYHVTVTSSTFLIWPTWKYVQFISLLPHIFIQCVFCTCWRTILWTKREHRHSLSEGSRQIFLVHTPASKYERKGAWLVMCPIHFNRENISRHHEEKMNS